MKNKSCITVPLDTLMLTTSKEYFYTLCYKSHKKTKKKKQDDLSNVDDVFFSAPHLLIPIHNTSMSRTVVSNDTLNLLNSSPQI